MVGYIHSKLEKLEAVLNDSSSGFIVGDSLTVADINVFVTMRYFNKKILDHCDIDLEKFPKLEEHRKKILAVKPIADWYKTERKGDGDELEGKGYELVYFPAEGRAEAIRLAFQCMGVEFRDIRIKGDTFKTMKDAGKFPTGQVPVLFIDGEPMVESMAILRYVGQLGSDSSKHLYPHGNNDVAAHIDSVFGQVEDVMKPVVISMHPPRHGLVYDEEDSDLEEKKNTHPMVLARVQEILKASAARVEGKISELKTNYLLGDKPTIADFLFFSTMQGLNQSQVPNLDTSSLMSDKAKIKEYVERMMQLKSVNSWYAAEHVEFKDELSGKGLELVYFDIAGLAEPIRLVLNHLNIKFTDVRLSRENFADWKKADKFPNGQVPVLFVDGKPIAQSMAILRYVGRLDSDHVLYPQDPRKAALVDAIIEGVMDMRGPLSSCYAAGRYGWELDESD